MATIRSPLLSLEAHGTIGDALTFSKHGRSHVARRKPIPGNTPGSSKMNQSPAQLAVQAQTKSLMQHWPEIAAEDQATWDALAIPAAVSRINAYLKENYRRLRSGQAATDVWPAVEALEHISLVDGDTPSDPSIAYVYEVGGTGPERPIYIAQGISPPVYLWYYALAGRYMISDSPNYGECTYIYINTIEDLITGLYEAYFECTGRANASLVP